MYDYVVSFPSRGIQKRILYILGSWFFHSNFSFIYKDLGLQIDYSKFAPTNKKNFTKQEIESDADKRRLSS